MEITDKLSPELMAKAKANAIKTAIKTVSHTCPHCGHLGEFYTDCYSYRALCDNCKKEYPITPHLKALKQLLETCLTDLQKARDELTELNAWKAHKHICTVHNLLSKLLNSLSI